MSGKASTTVSTAPSAMAASMSSRPCLFSSSCPGPVRACAMLTPLPATVQPDVRRYAGRMLPLIGVSTYVADVAWASWERRAAVLPESYFELVAAAGGRPLLLPPASTAPRRPRGRGGRGGRRARRPGPDRRRRRGPRRLRGGARPRGGRHRPEPGRQRAGPPRRRARGRPAGAGHLPGLPGAERLLWAGRCTSICPTWSGTSTTAGRPWSSRTSTWRRCPAPRAAGVFGAGDHRALLAPPGHPRPGPRPGRHRPRRRRRGRGGRAAARPASSWRCSGTPKRPWTSGPSTPWSRPPGTYMEERSVRATV